MLHVNDGYDRAIAALKAGPPIRPTKKLLIPEGLAARDVAALTPKVGLEGAADYEAAVKAAKPPAGFLAKGEKARDDRGLPVPGHVRRAAAADGRRARRPAARGVRRRTSPRST